MINVILHMDRFQDRIMKPLGGYMGYSSEWRDLAQTISRVSFLLLQPFFFVVCPYVWLVGMPVWGCVFVFPVLIPVSVVYSQVPHMARLVC